MKQCTVCNIEKELDKFQTYWHSTQQKHRTRGHCTECYYKLKRERRVLKREEAKLIQVSIKQEIIQPVQPELQPAILENNPNYKKCRTCQEYVHVDNYYHHKSRAKTSYLDCKTCIHKVENQKYKIIRENRRIENGGSSKHFQKPNKWVDDLQRESTFNILKAIGWNFNEDKGIWWKEGIKNQDGIFINVKSKGAINKRYLFGEYPESIRTEKQKDMFNDMLQLRLNGDTYETIANKLGISDSTVYKWLKTRK